MRFVFLKHIKDYYFPVFVGMAILIYIAQQYSFALPALLNNYVNDFLCMPIVLKICQYTVQRLKSDGNLQLPIGLAFTLSLFYALYFELVLPKFNTRYTTDWMDVALYGFGFLFFITIERVGITEKA